MSDLKQYMINRRDALLEINEFNMANEFEIMLEDFAEQLSIPSSAEERYRDEVEIEMALLRMWDKNGIEEIYKYKNRINWYRREGLARMELFHDITHRMFTDVQDTANGDELFVVDYKVRVEDLILKRQALSPSGEQKETPREALEQAIRDFPGDMTSGTSAQALINWLESTTSFVYDMEDDTNG
ncbi:hypothetical protein J19TS2_31090 [Cohnella xylanilytica]|uniref:hypothetical protein n=1 Tax=Cohnella xylanilytica TaxID=557555 RepID=UPI001B1DC2CF|nr:hypothetical protein [Cohnella xylanilytica]GIO13554.1 hypothetical protein J19TS2_31090 [Cohnella xylanilytica]